MLAMGSEGVTHLQLSTVLISASWAPLLSSPSSSLFVLLSTLKHLFWIASSFPTSKSFRSEEFYLFSRTLGSPEPCACAVCSPTSSLFPAGKSSRNPARLHFPGSSAVGGATGMRVGVMHAPSSQQPALKITFHNPPCSLSSFVCPPEGGRCPGRGWLRNDCGADWSAHLNSCVLWPEQEMSFYYA